MQYSSIIFKFLMMATAIFIPVAATDQYMRFNKLPKNNARIMLLSGGSLSSEETGIRHYTPNSLIRHSAVYNGDILEYSYEFNTDENGFRITHECSSKKNINNLITIAGDSFTEGQGSSLSWVESLQKQLCDGGYNSINTSMPGFGIEGMKDSLQYSYQILGSRKAIIAIITDDIYRPRTPMVSNDMCSMYKGLRCGDSATWWHHPKETNDNEIIAFASNKYEFGLQPVILGPLKDKIKPIAKILLRGKESVTSNDLMIERSISAMESIVKRFGSQNVSLFVLPTKNDRDLSGSIESKAKRRSDLRVFINSLDKGVSIEDLRECPLDARHFFPIDGHPNEEGHKKLAMCASKQIRDNLQH